MSTSFALARQEIDGAGPLLWFGLAIMFAPAAWVLLGDKASRGERLTLVLMLGVGLYLVKVLREPEALAFHDELAHRRAFDSLLGAGNLFRENPILPITSQFPGLHLLTVTVVNATGMSFFLAGTIVIGIARALMMLCLFLIIERVSGSARMAGIASCVYAGNLNFLYWLGQFSYESLALPLALFVLLVAIWKSGDRISAAGWWWIVLLLAVPAVVMTHHITAAVLTGVMIAWVALGGLLRLRSRTSSRPGSIALAAFILVSTGFWLLVVAPNTVDYLSPVLESGLSELRDLAIGSGSPRPLFTSAGEVAPIGERLLGIASVILVLACLPFALWWFRAQRSDDPLFAIFMIASIGFPFSLALRFTVEGAETAGRASEFLFVGVAVAVSLVAIEALRRRGNGFVHGVLSLALTLIFLGGFAAGWAYYARSPGPYLVSAGDRSVDSEGEAAARWAAQNLAFDSRFATDRVNGTLIGSIGEQHTVTAVTDDTNVAPLYFADELGPTEREILREGPVEYLLADLRLAESLPWDGIYVEKGEPTGSLTSSDLSKFGDEESFGRPYDAGNIKIYDVISSP